MGLTRGKSWTGLDLEMTRGKYLSLHFQKFAAGVELKQEQCSACVTPVPLLGRHVFMKTSVKFVGI